MGFVDPTYFKDQFGVEGKVVLLTFGLLSPNKGIEYVLNALPQIVAELPDVVYIVLGATHPNELREHGEAYRLGLEILAKKQKVEKNVIFYNQFVDLENLKEFLGAADLYITPYLNEAQITSGTLAYAFGSGKAVVSTPYWHAAELLAEDRGVLVPFRDSQADSSRGDRSASRRQPAPCHAQERISHWPRYGLEQCRRAVYGFVCGSATARNGTVSKIPCHQDPRPETSRTA